MLGVPSGSRGMSPQIVNTVSTSTQQTCHRMIVRTYHTTCVWPMLQPLKHRVRAVAMDHRKSSASCRFSLAQTLHEMAEQLHAAAVAAIFTLLSPAHTLVQARPLQSFVREPMRVVAPWLCAAARCVSTRTMRSLLLRSTRGQTTATVNHSKRNGCRAAQAYRLLPSPVVPSPSSQPDTARCRGNLLKRLATHQGHWRA